VACYRRERIMAPGQCIAGMLVRHHLNDSGFQFGRGDAAQL